MGNRKLRQDANIIDTVLIYFTVHQISLSKEAPPHLQIDDLQIYHTLELDIQPSEVGL